MSELLLELLRMEFSKYPYVLNIFFPLQYLGVKQRNLTKMAIFLPVTENYWGGKSQSSIFPPRIMGEKLNSSFVLFFLMKLSSLCVIRPEKCRPVRIMLELVPQRTVTGTDCPL